MGTFRNPKSGFRQYGDQPFGFWKIFETQWGPSGIPKAASVNMGTSLLASGKSLKRNGDLQESHFESDNPGARSGPGICGPAGASWRRSPGCGDPLENQWFFERSFCIPGSTPKRRFEFQGSQRRVPILTEAPFWPSRDPKRSSQRLLAAILSSRNPRRGLL